MHYRFDFDKKVRKFPIEENEISAKDFCDRLLKETFKNTKPTCTFEPVNCDPNDIFTTDKGVLVIKYQYGHKFDTKEGTAKTIKKKRIPPIIKPMPALYMPRTFTTTTPMYKRRWVSPPPRAKRWRSRSPPPRPRIFKGTFKNARETSWNTY
jgi:hypothetical protein